MRDALPPRVRSLSVHASYRCADSGACCSSGWDIPVEPPVEEGLRRAMADGRLVPADGLRPVPGLPHGARVVLARDARTGHCVFQDPGPQSRCRVHARLGEEALASACRQFPRVVTLTPLGVSVTLSHHCPTAASLLFDAPGPLRIVEAPPAFPASWPFEGLDARDALPPLLRPGVLASWPALERWEEHAVATLADESMPPEEAVARLADDAERARAWTASQGDLDGYLATTLARAAERPRAAPGRAPSHGASSWDVVAATVPAGHPRPVNPRGAIDRAGTDRTRSLLDDGWTALRRPIRAWLAAKAFASWLPLQGEGLRTTALGLGVVLDVLRCEAARGCAEAGGALDRERLKQAIRRADLLLVHLADPQALASRLGACERPGGGVLASLGPA